MIWALDESASRLPATPESCSLMMIAAAMAPMTIGMMTSTTSSSTRVNPASGCRSGHEPTLTWWKMPYMAETRAMATKPTMRPTAMMTAGSIRAVKRLIL